MEKGRSCGRKRDPGGVSFDPGSEDAHCSSELLAGRAEFFGILHPKAYNLSRPSESSGRGQREKKQECFPPFNASGEKEERDQERRKLPLCKRARDPCRKPTSLIMAQGLCTVWAALSYSSDSAQGPPVPQEKAETDATLLRHDERCESEEVGGTLSLGSQVTVLQQPEGAEGRGRGSRRENIPPSPFAFFPTHSGISETRRIQSSQVCEPKRPLRMCAECLRCVSC